MDYLKMIANVLKLTIALLISTFLIGFSTRLSISMQLANKFEDTYEIFYGSDEDSNSHSIIGDISSISSYLSFSCDDAKELGIDIPDYKHYCHSVNKIISSNNYFSYSSRTGESAYYPYYIELIDLYDQFYADFQANVQEEDRESWRAISIHTKYEKSKQLQEEIDLMSTLYNEAIVELSNEYDRFPTNLFFEWVSVRLPEQFA